MPMSKTEDYGFENDGVTRSEDYCAYCYENGSFTSDCSMEEMIEFCINPVVENVPGMTRESAKKMMDEMFPSLKRWKK